MKMAGWVYARSQGPHDVWEAPNGVALAVPRHTEVSVGIVRQYHDVMKEMGK